MGRGTQDWSSGSELGPASTPASGLECHAARWSVPAVLRSQGGGKEAARGPRMSGW